MDEEILRYPIGVFTPQERITEETRNNYIVEIAGIVPTLQETVKILNGEQIHVPYRTNGWTVQQVIHHMADNDMNAFIRLKRALTETEPQATSYREDLWAVLNDYRETPVIISITLLEAIHFRLCRLLEGMNAEDFEKKFRTNVLGLITADVAVQRFIWHNKHHIVQIQELIKRMQW
ncbi:putative metal-dependent hydrolase [Xylanibacillus composti]|uniref:Putative metal-dependent hydrolase n=1 Tax=Xylanibacillus composti TaxID=1572762 RepID=A0A8J4H7P3_9BACL|nr:putative metal-dependent hydrolase [Xylanibacillus composti]MDT9727146.1 putative metal-dependent hydrolase [Xylanibacillus composti]GIQ71410.1 putative metal-dependent hydrolase [Xylanibacillus composti]